ncbi:hypothetical protein Val02_08040 [Virgisporangium aliadipatigenens]|uniref:SRPBCC family protein n=1 Tax=Virgisporangium aliadipatigenens TaxID=741659 RepID=A0A8J4DNT4_9ACTN|nr:SRPBCC family protein [Virgisporangium aliadipatigenens]GIJ43918.1 hypothetical protein Val02_08040 [Virgisporangium aliadipatigenens]
MRNTHHREFAVPAPVLGALLDGLPQRLWPGDRWPPSRLDDGLAVGSRDRHGPIRYTVVEYEPGRRLRFAFDPTIGLDGFHEFRVEEVGAGRSRLVHDMGGRLHGAMVLGWPLAFRWLHDALLRDLLDNAERAATGAVRRPARWSPYVRLLRSLASRRRPAVART